MLLYRLHLVSLLLLFMVMLTHSKLKDWLINDVNVQRHLVKNSDGSLTLTNGLISRVFSTSPGFTTIDYYSHEKQTSLLRALSAEASIKLDQRVYNVGSVKATMSRSYLNRTALNETIQVDLSSFQYVGHTTSQPVAPYPYKPMRGAPIDVVWPPAGLRLNVNFRAPNVTTVPINHRNVMVTVHYEIYDGIPAMSKWITVSVPPPYGNIVRATILTVETLAVNEPFSKISTFDGSAPILDNPDNAYDWLYVETDQAHGTVVKWFVDPSAKSSPGSYQPVVQVSSNPQPSFWLTTEGLASYRVIELAHCSSDSTRKALSINRLHRLLTPHIQENPIYFHLTNSSSKAFRAAVDQLAEVGFEMIIYSFGSGFQMESKDIKYIQQIKEDVAYANSKGLEVGGYDLIVLDRTGINADHSNIDVNGNPTISACMASGWYEVIADKVISFLETTNMTMIETDGPYGGSACYSTWHKHHEGYHDSVYHQARLQNTMYTELRKKGIYINAPDVYYYAGSNRQGLGYNEDQYSLPRWEDLGVSRQNMFDRLYSLPPTAGWMFVPLVQYHGGGAAAQFEPLSSHLDEFNMAFAQYMGAGVAACYRGYRIFDSNNTKAIVESHVMFYKKYRDILTSDIVRITRPDMQGLDAFMHVNHKLKIKGLVMVFNPTSAVQKTTLTLPLYYTGLKHHALISEQAYDFEKYELDVGAQGWQVDVSVQVQSYKVTWFLLKATDDDTQQDNSPSKIKVVERSVQVEREVL